MRVGLHQARINGIGADLIDVGSLSGSGLAQQDLQSYLSSLASYMEQGIAKTPDQFRAAVTQDVTDYCRAFQGRCTGGESAAIDSVVAQYTTAYQQEYQRVQAGIASGSISLPGGSTVVPQQPAQTQYTYQASNALDRTAPQISNVTPVPTTQALTPPQTPPLVQTQPAAGSSVLGARPGEFPPGYQMSTGGMSGIGTQLLLAGGGILLLVMMMSGRK